LIQGWGFTLPLPFLERFSVFETKFLDFATEESVPMSLLIVVVIEGVCVIRGCPPKVFHVLLTKHWVYRVELVEVTVAAWRPVTNPEITPPPMMVCETACGWGRIYVLPKLMCKTAIMSRLYRNLISQSMFTTIRESPV